MNEQINEWTENGWQMWKGKEDELKTNSRLLMVLIFKIKSKRGYLKSLLYSNQVAN